LIRKDAQSKIKQGSLIGPGTHVAGQVFFGGELFVEGSVHGSVCALPDQPATLVISDQARIDGEVRVAHLVVAGTINGQVTSSQAIEFRPSARVTGDVYYRRIEMQRGSIVEGRLTHRSTE
jgi:cytoskeletal protein CcmA (bactofilin family)